MTMFHGDPLMRRVTEIIDRLVESGIYSQWGSPRNELMKLRSRKIGIVHPLDGYYSFNLYHMQPAFYLLLMGWCLSAFCFMIEVLYNRVLRQKSEFWNWLEFLLNIINAVVTQDYVTHNLPVSSLLCFSE